ncbi:MAG: 5'-nucleotidase [Gammaproteobacteria bacterium]|nr:5'-nucleotidase [Gammaproteobacteria bacterium]
MNSTFADKLIVAVSSRALFDLTESNRVYEEQGIKSYSKHQIAHEDEPLQPGVAHSLVKKLLALNKYGDYVEIILISRNSADTGLRIFNSIEHDDLDISRAAFTSGRDPYQYAKAFHAHLFLSANAEDVESALKAGCAAAHIYAKNPKAKTSNQLRVAFDGDAVLFSDESEQIYHEQGLEAFIDHEKKLAKKPMSAGPFRKFLSALQKLQSKLPSGDKTPIRTALITARSAPTHERVIRTFRAWQLRIDESVFLGGLQKGEFLRAFGADIYFDDQLDHCKNSQSAATCHVPHGVKNQKSP